MPQLRGVRQLRIEQYERRLLPQPDAALQCRREELRAGPAHRRPRDVVEFDAITFALRVLDLLRNDFRRVAYRAKHRADAARPADERLPHVAPVLRSAEEDAHLHAARAVCRRGSPLLELKMRDVRSMHELLLLFGSERREQPGVADVGLVQVFRDQLDTRRTRLRVLCEVLDEYPRTVARPHPRGDRVDRKALCVLAIPGRCELGHQFGQRLHGLVVDGIRLRCEGLGAIVAGEMQLQQMLRLAILASLLSLGHEAAGSAGCRDKMLQAFGRQTAAEFQLRDRSRVRYGRPLIDRAAQYAPKCGRLHVAYVFVGMRGPKPDVLR
jgi:hypothetical protein